MTVWSNIAQTLTAAAKRRGAEVALRCPGTRGSDGFARYDEVLTFRELDQRSDAIARGLGAIGLVPGMRAVLMVRPSPEFFVLMFALFKAGAVPVLVDPGIDRRALRACLGEAEPHAFIGIPLAQAARTLLRWAPTATLKVWVGRGGYGGPTLTEVEDLGFLVGGELPPTGADDMAAILFTSGATGVPKGVVYRHRHFLAQVEMLRDAFGIVPGGVDLPTFPPFALFDPALGLTSVVPDMDPAKPGRANAARLFEAIERFGVTQLFGSPALLEVLVKHDAEMPGVRRILSAGAPVPARTVAAMRELLPRDAEIWTPYGATECLPVAVIEGRELESTRAVTEAGAGTCVGRPVPPNDVRIIAIREDAITEWRDASVLPDGVVGEITVSGPTTTEAYFNRNAATRLAKIREVMADGSERIVHRMGDVGYFDAEGRLWFCGRMGQRVRAAAGDLYTEQVEPIFNAIDGVRRAALVGVSVRDPLGVRLRGQARAIAKRGRSPAVVAMPMPQAPQAQHAADAGFLVGSADFSTARDTERPVLVLQLMPGARVLDRVRIETVARRLCTQFAHTRAIDDILFHPTFPVDTRHNSKIDRARLAHWAARRLTRG